MILKHQSCSHPDQPHCHGQDGEDPDRPGLLSVLFPSPQHGGDAGDEQEQEAGVGEGEQVCDGGGVDAGVGGAGCQLCEEQGLCGDRDLDQDTEEEEEGLVDGGEPVHVLVEGVEVHQPDQQGGVEHGVGDWN